MYMDIETEKDIYRLNFASTMGIVDIRVANCIDVSIRMALAEYDGILVLPGGENFTSLQNLGDMFGSNSDHALGSDNGSDVFLEEFLSKCGIYLGDKLYKPKKTTN